LADAKNHGMMMLVDYSGSMQNIIAQVMRQVMTLSMFCKKANIPYRVYGFTSGDNNNKYDTNLDLGQVRLFELFSNEMTRVEFDTAFYQMYTQSWEIAKSTWGYPAYMSKLEFLGGTPLNESLLAMDKLIPLFKTKYSLDKVNLTVLTDGDANNMYLNSEHAGSTVPRDYRRVITRVGGRRIEIANRFGTERILNELRRAHDCTTLGYYIPSGNYDFRNRMYRLGINSEEGVKERRREYLKQKFTTFDDALGYDRYFILRSGRDLDVKTEEFDVMAGAKKGELARQFKKFAGSKKGNRVLATRFAEVIA
jgi:hypothetical protein